MDFLLSFFIIFSLFTATWDALWYATRQVPLPFITSVIFTLISFIYLCLKKITSRTAITTVRELKGLIIFFFFALFSILGLYVNEANNEQFKQFIKTSGHLFFYIIYIYVITELFQKTRLRKLIRIYYFIGMLAAVVGILQFIHLNWFSIYGFDSLDLDHRELYAYGPSRVASVFDEPAWFSYFLINQMGLSLVYIFNRGWRKEIFYFLIFFIGFLASGSFGGYVVLGIFIFIVLLQLKIIRGKIAFITAISLILFTILPLLTQFVMESVGRRVSPILTGTDSSFLQRWDSAQATVKVWLKNPLFGVGTGNASFYTPEFYQGEWLDRILDPTAHITSDNAYTLILAENGILGFIAVFVLYFTLIKRDNTVILGIRMINKYRPGTAEYDFCEFSLFMEVLRITVILSFLELFIVSGFLTPGFWFNIGLYLALKRTVRESGIII